MVKDEYKLHEEDQLPTGKDTMSFHTSLNCAGKVLKDCVDILH